MTTHLVIPDLHATPGKNNNRAEWIGCLIHELRPTVVIDLGDSADMASLSDHDRGLRSFVGKSYKKDIEAYLDLQDKLWHRARKSKKKLPRAVRLVGNHEHRLTRIVERAPELEGTVDYADFEWGRYYDTVVPYDGNSPGAISIDGITYAHFFASGVMGRPVSGEHPAYSLLTKHHASCTQGHVHTFDYCVRTTQDGRKLHGLVAGCAVDYKMHWPGETQKLWTTGVAIKRNVEKGQYDLEWVSLDRLKKEYGE